MFKAILIISAILLIPVMAAGQTGEIYYQLEPLIAIGNEVRVRLAGEPETWISGDVKGYDFMTLEIDISGTSMSISMARWRKSASTGKTATRRARERR